MSTSPENLQLTPEQYLSLEQLSTARHEFVNGRMFAMVGATEAHNSILSNLHLIIGSALKGTKCRSFVNDMKVFVEKSGSFYYPDLMVTCEPYKADALFKTAPHLIVEILSPSTADIDRREKLKEYRSIESLAAYMIVYQDERKVELYRRSKDQVWSVSVYSNKDSFPLLVTRDVEIVVDLGDVYERVLS